MPDGHQNKIRAVSEQVLARPPRSKITILKTTPSHSIRDPGYKTNCHPVDVSALNEVLGIETARRLATVEGQVTIGELARATLAEGLLPAVVPEFRQFTVSGLINSEGIQSSSHRYGTFSQTLESVEVLLADGSVVNASATSHSSLFAALPESLGTLGIVTAATVRLVPAGPFVKTSCRAFSTLREYLAAFCATLGTCAFHEGVIFGPRLHMLITGDFVDDGGATATLHPEQRGNPYFYQYVRKVTAERGTTVDTLETLSYLSRSERGMWWMAECHADFPLLTETTWGRRHVDDQVAQSYSRNGLTASDHMTALERSRCVISQDMGVTLQRLGEGITWVQERLGVYPIWNCAVCLPNPGSAARETSYVVDIGIYGEPTVPGYRHIRDMRALQQMAEAPSLWGTSYLTWDELYATNPRRYDAYERARTEAGSAGAFLHIRDKVVWVDGSQPDEGRIPMWRLRRSFGKRWYLNPLVYPLLATVLASKLIWRAPTAR